MIIQSSIWVPLIGGMVIGLAASFLLASLGRVSGISGIISGLFSAKSEDAGWRLSFLLGLLVAGTTLLALHIGPAQAPAETSVPRLVIAGLLVGFGARLGGGCTSGHGVCGISRLSPRSIVATCTFIASGALTVFVLRHVLTVMP